MNFAEDGAEAKGFLRHPLLAIACWVLRRNGATPSMAAHSSPALDYDTDSTGSLCERHSSWSSDASGSAILSSVTADDAPLAAPAGGLGSNPNLLLPKILINNTEDVPDPLGVPAKQQVASWDGHSLGLANEEPPLVESSPNWGWYVSTGTPTAPQFSSTSST